MAVDSYAYMDRMTRMVMKAWVKREQSVPRDIPWTPLEKPLSDCRIALLSSAGIALKDDQPFDQEGERENPWWGDPTHRTLPADVKAEDCSVYHLHIDPRAPSEDLNICLPLDRTRELVADGVLGELAATHYSIMGYLLEPKRLLEETIPKIVAQLREEEVDVVLLVPV